MTAPTAVEELTTTASSTLTLAGATALNATDLAAGKYLAVMVAEGTTTGVGSSGATTMNRAGSADSGWNCDIDIKSNSGAGTNALRVWSKVLGASDVDGSNKCLAFGPASAASGSTLRLQLIVFRHDNGWSTTAATRRVDALTANGALVANGATMFTPTDSPRPTACVIPFSSGLASSAQVTDPGGANNHAPTFGFNLAGSISTSSGACQCDVRLLDSSDSISGVAITQGSANTTHANAFVQYVTLAVAYSGYANLNNASDGLGKPATKYSARGRVDGTSNIYPRIAATFPVRGRADTTSDAIARGGVIYHAGARLDTAGNLTVVAPVAAPKIIYAEATRTAAANVLPTNTVTADATGAVLLAVLCATASVATLAANAGVHYNDTNGDAGWAIDATQDSVDGTRRTIIWSKVLTAADFTSGNLRPVTPAGWTGSGTARLELLILSHADGWDDGRKAFTGAETANVANGSTVVSLDDSPYAGIAFAALTGAGTSSVTWDSDAPKTPYFNGGSGTSTSGPNDGSHTYGTANAACQADFKQYNSTDAGTALAVTSGLTNTAHAIVVVYYQSGQHHSVGSSRIDAVGDSRGAPKASLHAGARLDTISNAQGRQPSIQTAGAHLDTSTDLHGQQTPLGAPVDTVDYSYGFSTVIYHAGARLDTISSLRGPVPARGQQTGAGTLDTTGDMAGRAHATYVVGASIDTTSDAGGTGGGIIRAGGRLDAAASARGFGDAHAKQGRANADTVSALSAAPTVTRSVGGRLDNGSDIAAVGSVIIAVHSKVTASKITGRWSMGTARVSEPSGKITTSWSGSLA